MEAAAGCEWSCVSCVACGILLGSPATHCAWVVAEPCSKAELPFCRPTVRGVAMSVATWFNRSTDAVVLAMGAGRSGVWGREAAVWNKRDAQPRLGDSYDRNIKYVSRKSIAVTDVQLYGDSSSFPSVPASSHCTKCRDSLLAIGTEQDLQIPR